MNLQKMIAELQAEKARLDDAILALERLSSAGAKRRRGRPPRWLKNIQNGSSNGGDQASDEPPDAGV